MLNPDTLFVRLSLPLRKYAFQYLISVFVYVWVICRGGVSYNLYNTNRYGESRNIICPVVTSTKELFVSISGFFGGVSLHYVHTSHRNYIHVDHFHSTFHEP